MTTLQNLTIDQLMDLVFDLKTQLTGAIQLPEKRAQLTSELGEARRTLYFKRLEERQK